MSGLESQGQDHRGQGTVAGAVCSQRGENSWGRGQGSSLEGRNIYNLNGIHTYFIVILSMSRNLLLELDLRRTATFYSDGLSRFH